MNNHITPKKPWTAFIASLPGIGVALLPKCPMCLGVFGGAITVLGFSFSDYKAYLLPITIFCLLIAISSFIYGAKNRYGYGPLLLALIASAVILIGKFHFGINIMLYSGVMLLIIASIWNSWPRKLAHSGSCGLCKNEPKEI